MPKTVFEERTERASAETTDEYGNDVTIVREVVDRGHLGKTVVASARRGSDGLQIAYAEGPDALRRVATALGVTMIGLLVVASVGVIVYMLATGMVG